MKLLIYFRVLCVGVFFVLSTIVSFAEVYPGA